MRYQKLIPIALLCLLFAACKKDGDPKNGQEETIAKILTAINLHDAAAVKYKEVFLSTGDSLDALIGMANWCLQQPEVKTVFLTDHCMMHIHFKNGLITPVTVIPVNAAGIHLLRGGGTGALTNLSSNKASDEDEYVITNNKAMIFIPYLGQFYGSSYPFLPKFSEGKQKLTPTLLLEEEADLPAINTFADYGFIILNTHGSTNGFAIMTKITEFDDPWVPGRTPFTETQLKSIMARNNNLPPDKVENGELELSFKIYVKEGASVNTIECSHEVLVTDRYIRTIPKLDKAIVFGNHCYSAYTKEGPETKNLPEAWKSAGAISYYGYAFADGSTRQAGNDFCVRMEDSLITNLLYDLDSTGIAHLANDVANQFQPGVSKITGGVQMPPPPPQPDTGGVVMAVAYDKVKYNEDYPKIPMDFFFEHFHDKRYRYEPCGSDTITIAGEQYPTVCIGGKVWMAKNLNMAGAGVCYDNNSANCSLYGRLYSIEELTNLDTSSANPSGVRGLCPQGWHVPSTAEWEALFAAAGSAGKLCATEDWPAPNNNTNELGLSLVPGGMYEVINDTTSAFSEAGRYGHYWSSSRSSDGQFYRSVLLLKSTGSNSMNFNDEAELQYEDFENYGTKYMSCRCVKD